MKFEDIKLGDTVRDTVTEYVGKVVAKTEWMNGCHRVTLQASGLLEGKVKEAYHCDVQQLELVIQAIPLSEVPKGGPRDEPKRNPDPIR